MYADDVNEGYVQQPTLSKKLVCQAIENALAADMYVIVDWHTLKEENPLKNVSQAKNFLKKFRHAMRKSRGFFMRSAMNQMVTPPGKRFEIMQNR